MPKRMIGTVRWYNTEKGYGFIGRESGEDIFVHISSIQRTEHQQLVKGQRVEFSVEENPKGLQASSVIIR